MKGDAAEFCAGLLPGRATGHLIGWRVWEITAEGLLGSVWLDDTVWSPGQPIIAEFRHHPMWAFPASAMLLAALERQGPIESGAGIHALKARYLAQSLAAVTGLILGRVALWGEIAEHERGYRAQYAYPVSLVVPWRMREIGCRLAERYGCRVERVDRPWLWWLRDLIGRWRNPAELT